MATQNLTAAIIEKLQYTDGSKKSSTGKLYWPRQVLWDSKVPGFGVRVTPANKRFYVVSYRSQGRCRLMSLGRYGDFANVTQARERAAEHLRSLRRDKVDPLIERTRERASGTISEMFVPWLASVKKRRSARTHRDYQYAVKGYLNPEFGHHRPADLTRGEVRRLHTRLTDKNGPINANRIIQILRAAYGWTIKQESETLPPNFLNPCCGVEFNPERSREEFVKPEEMAFLSFAIGGEADPWVRAFLWLLIQTAARGGELVQLKWANVHIEAGEMILRDTKNGSNFRVRLSTPSINVLRGIPRTESEYVFPPRRKDCKTGHMSVPRLPWKRVLKEAKINPDVHKHDIRRSAGVFLSMRGFTAEQISRSLNNKTDTAAKIYIRIADQVTQEMSDALGAVSSGPDTMNFIKPTRRLPRPPTEWVPPGAA